MTTKYETIKVECCLAVDGNYPTFEAGTKIAEDLGLIPGEGSISSASLAGLLF